jgi:hypothetical protein
MFKFTVKCIILSCTLLFGLLLGIHHAERGIYSIDGGTTDQQESFYIKKIDEEHVEVAVLGEAFNTKELEAKQEKWRERQHHNNLSRLGNKLGDVIYSVSRKGAEWFVDQVDKLL